MDFRDDRMHDCHRRSRVLFPGWQRTWARRNRDRWYGKRREEDPLDVRVCKKEKTESKIEPEWIIALKSSLASTGLETPRHQRLSSREMQWTTVESCLLANGSSDLRWTLLFKPLSGENPITKFSRLPHLAKSYFVDELAARKYCEAEQRREQAVQSRRILGKRNIRQQGPYCYIFVGGTVFWTLVCFARLLYFFVFLL